MLKQHFYGGMIGKASNYSCFFCTPLKYLLFCTYSSNRVLSFMYNCMVFIFSGIDCGFVLCIWCINVI